MKKLTLLTSILIAFPMTLHAFDQSSPPDSLVVDVSGNVGVGTAAPTSPLHVLKAGAELAVEDNSPSVAVRNVVKLRNNGSVGFELRDTNLNNAWDFRTAANGGFLVSNIGVPGSKLQINQDGAVFLNGAKFILNSAGNMTVAGNSTALAHISTSSREVKTDFAKVDPKAVMAKIKDMEVSEWRYKDKAAKGRHIGPVAEDFYKLFGLGPDNKHVAATDMASIALIAAQELQKKSDAFSAETSALKAKNYEIEQQLLVKTNDLKTENKLLKERLASLENLVMNLASGKNTLPASGKQVVLNQ